MSEEISQQQPERSVIPHIEVVNEIQIVVSNKRDNVPRSSCAVTTTPNDSKDARKCVSSRSSKTDITATTATLDTTTKQVTIKNERRASKGEKSEGGSTICVCGKLLKRVKELLEAKETKAKSELEFLFLCMVWACSCGYRSILMGVMVILCFHHGQNEIP
jgi:50S ribosomal subunit-associated GTPase HflX